MQGTQAIVNAPAFDVRPDGVLIVAIGVSRSGKSVWLKEAIKDDQRVIAFDPKGEYYMGMGYWPCRTRAELIAALRASTGAAKICYLQHDKKEFDFFCDAAFNWNRLARCTIIAEELGNTTNCGKASGHWGRLISQGLAYAPKVIGTVQRGQEVDKSIINNASFLHICRHSTSKDQKYIADQLGISPNDVPSVPLEFIQWSSDKGLVVSGAIDFRNVDSASGKGSPVFRKKFAVNQGVELLTFGNNGKFSEVVYR